MLTYNVVTQSNLSSLYLRSQQDTQPNWKSKQMFTYKHVLEGPFSQPTVKEDRYEQVPKWGVA